MLRKRRAFKVSRLTLIRRKPAATIKSAFFDRNWPFVVTETSFKGSCMTAGRNSSNFGANRGSPPVIRSLSMPADSTRSRTARRSSSALNSATAAWRRFPSGTQ